VTGGAELAVWRPESGTWYVRGGDGSVESTQFGLTGDIPSPSDIDGDGKADFVVYRPQTGLWLILGSEGDSLLGEVSLGAVGARVANDSRAAIVDRSAVGDYNGDRLTDLTVFRATENNTLLFLFLTGTGIVHSMPSVEFGQVGDVIVPGDFDGDGISDLAVVEQSGGSLAWRILLSSEQDGGRRELIVVYGLSGDEILPADFDGDGKTDLNVVRNMPDGTKLWLPNSSGQVPLEPVSWGFSSDIALTGDIDGDGRSDYIVVRQQNGELLWLIRTASGATLEPKLFGFPTDQLRVLDFDGDGKDEIAVLRNEGGFRLIVPDGGTPFFWGLSSDTSLSGNYGGLRGQQAGVWRIVSGQGFFFIRSAGPQAFGVPFGVEGDTPLLPGQVVETGLGIPSPTGDVDPSSTDGEARLNGVSRTSVTEQNNGFVWKPVSEGDGNLVVLFSASRAGTVLRAALVEPTAESDVVLETLRFVGDTNGGRPTFRADRPGGNYPANVILVRQSQDESVNCIDVPNPGQRYD